MSHGILADATASTNNQAGFSGEPVSAGRRLDNVWNTDQMRQARARQLSQLRNDEVDDLSDGWQRAVVMRPSKHKRVSTSLEEERLTAEAYAQALWDEPPFTAPSKGAGENRPAPIAVRFKGPIKSFAKSATAPTSADIES